MRIIPFIVALSCLAWAGYRRDWFDLAWATAGILLLGFDGAISILRAAVIDGANK